MSSWFEQPWFWPALAVVIGLPVLLIVLTELGAVLTRRANPAAKIVRLLRNFVVPLAALFVLLSQVSYLNVDATWSRVVATLLGFVVILVLLSSLNVALFSTAKRGTWRRRMPSIFVDIVRLVLILVSLALLFTWVWNVDVGGLFTALGVTSIVIGLALQQAAGSVVTGLLLLFEQPFQLGDWLEVDGTRGQVIEVNWRAVHVDTHAGVLIIPTASLAGSTFTNLSKISGVHTAQVEVPFSTDDAPQEVLALLRRVGGDLPDVPKGMKASALPLGGARYSVTIPVRSPAEEEETVGLFLVWLWYAARRAGLHLDGDLTDDYATPERLADSLARVASSLQLSTETAAGLVSRARLERYGSGEILQRAGALPDGMRVIISGTGRLSIPLSDGALLRIAQLGERDLLGLTAITRGVTTATAVAITDVTVVVLSTELLDELVSGNPALARQIGDALDNRGKQAKAALEAAGLAQPLSALVA